MIQEVHRGPWFRRCLCLGGRNSINQLGSVQCRDHGATNGKSRWSHEESEDSANQLRLSGILGTGMRLIYGRSDRNPA
jgi:hypothetical protein